ncbi:MAG: hypothetical protein AAGH68_03175 [Pseudomonadota bacterium]
MPAVGLSLIAIFLTDAPAEWARGALTAYLAVIGAMALGSVVAKMGAPILPLIIAVVLVVALIVGGRTGVSLAALALIAMLAWQFSNAAWPLHPLLIPVLAASATAAAARAFL